MAASDEKRPWGAVWLLCTAMIIAYIHRVDLSLALSRTPVTRPLRAPLMQEEFGWSDTQLGQAHSAFFWPYFMLQIPAGLAARRWGVRFVYWVGFLIWCFATAASALTVSLSMLIGLRLLLGLGQAILTPAGMRYIRLSFEEEQRGSAVGIFMAGTKIGPALGFVISAYLLEAFGWRGMFAVLGLVALIWLVPFFLRIKKDDPAAQPARGEDTAAGGSVSTRAILRSPVIWGTILGTFCYMYFVYYCMTWMPSYFEQQYGMSIKEQGWYSAVAFGGMAIVIVLAGWAADALIQRGYDAVNVRKGFTIAGFLCASTQTIAAFTDSVPVMLFFAVFSLCGLGLMTANYWALTLTLMPGARIAMVVGIQNMAANFAGAVAPLLTGWLVDRTGSFDAPIQTVAVWLAIGMASYLFLVRRKYAPKAEEVA
jgi:ACS family D-galactonate transporter-like MFS transporter